jgi:hypothetical protein
MSAAKIVLWIQLPVGLIGCLLAFGYIGLGAQSYAWAHNLRTEYGRMKQSPGFQEPAKIHDVSWDKILEDFEAYGRARADVAWYCALACVALALFAAVALWLLSRSAQPTAERLQTQSYPL